MSDAMLWTPDSDNDPTFTITPSPDSGTVDTVARAAISNHAAETTEAHGGIVADDDARLSDARTPTAHTHPWSEVTPKPTFGTAAAEDASAFATAAQGGLADTAVQPAGLASAIAGKADTSSLATVATSGDYDDLDGRPTLGTAAAQDSTAFATSAQGGLADSAVQPGDLAAVATSGSYDDLTGQPAIPADAADVGAVAVTAGIVVVDAGDDLSTARPSGAAVAYFVFDDDSVDAGSAGENIVNAQPGDLWFVPDA